jgi:hypothetical protein
VLQTKQQQLHELLGLMKGCAITKKVNLFAQENESLNELIIALENCRTANQRIVDEAVKYGYNGADVAAASIFLGEKFETRQKQIFE